MTTATSIVETHRRLVERLLAARSSNGVWVGELASSALSTATAATALAVAREAATDVDLTARGLRWLAQHQNADGGWGDTTLSRSNISTTALCWAAFAFAPPHLSDTSATVSRCERWLERAAGGLGPELLRDAISARYGKDRTFSAPILTTLAIAGRLGSNGWRLVPQLPFELAACPRQWFEFLQLPVVSYALPALIAIGQVRHHHRPSRNIVLRVWRERCALPTRRVLGRIQPSTGGYLEATPLTSFVVMSLAAMQQGHHAVAREGLRFLRHSIREDGSWPIDTDLSTWVTTLAVKALASASCVDQELTRQDRERLTRWLLTQQHSNVHDYTGAPPGGWAWTPLPGGVPDADDTAGALVALKQLNVDDNRISHATAAGIEWLLSVQNRDGGIPTFCRGWGALPFDRSTPDLTAHALLAWAAWRDTLAPDLRRRVNAAVPRALAYLANSQRHDGAWIPLWFGNEHAADEVNATYGTAKVVKALVQLVPHHPKLTGATEWLLQAQNADGGWGGDIGVSSSIEETSFAVEALATIAAAGATGARIRSALARGADWLVSATDHGRITPSSPIGLYFAKLWYFEALYPLIFAAAALGRLIAETHSRR